VGVSRSFLAEAAEVVVLALGLYLVITFAIQTVHVIGLSMYSTLDDNDYLIANKLDYRLHPPQRGDVIIMRDPFDSSKDFIKRVIALPGEELLIKDAHVYINGHLLNEPYLRTDEPWNNNANWPAPGSQDAGLPRTLPANQYFVMGDNRNASSDSRVFGWVARDRIEARAWLRIWPLPKLGPIDQVKPMLATSSSLPVAA
jgi:signal peptidase I